MLSGDLLNPFLPRDLADLVCEYIEAGIELAAMARADYWPAVLNARLQILFFRWHPRIEPFALCELLQNAGAVIAGSALLPVLLPLELDRAQKPVEKHVYKWWNAVRVDIFVPPETSDTIYEFFKRCGYVTTTMHDWRPGGVNVDWPVQSVTRVYRTDSAAAVQVVVVKDPVRHVEDNFDFRALRNWADGARFHVGHPREVATRTIHSADVLESKNKHNAVNVLYRLRKYSGRGFVIDASHRDWHNEVEPADRPLCVECHATVDAFTHSAGAVEDIGILSWGGFVNWCRILNDPAHCHHKFIRCDLQTRICNCACGCKLLEQSDP